MEVRQPEQLVPFYSRCFSPFGDWGGHVKVLAGRVASMLSVISHRVGSCTELISPVSWRVGRQGGHGLELRGRGGVTILVPPALMQGCCLVPRRCRCSQPERAGQKDMKV